MYVPFVCEYVYSSQPEGLVPSFQLPVKGSGNGMPARP